MVELIPFKRGDNIYFIGSATEFTIIFDEYGSPLKILFWVGGECYNVMDFYDPKSGELVFSDIRIPLWKWFEKGVPVYYRTCESLDTYSQILASKLASIENSKLAIAFSGGKDSTVSALVMNSLREKMGFDLNLVYVHMPFLEPLENITEAKRLSSRLGLDMEVIEPPRWVVAKHMLNEGLPYRRNRWCTYLKVKPLETCLKREGIEFMAVGDRIWETWKRFKRLVEHVKEGKIPKKGRKLFIVAQLTITDVATALRENKLVHSLYLRGSSRVSCLLCPYKSTYDILIERNVDVEDPGFIDHIVKMEWRRWYRKHVPQEDFEHEHLWRYVPSISEMFYRAKLYVAKHGERLEHVKLNALINCYTQIWIKDVEYPCKSIEEIIDKLPSAKSSSSEGPHHLDHRVRPLLQDHILCKNSVSSSKVWRNIA